MDPNCDNTPELRDALFRAICLLDHAKPENDTDYGDTAKEITRQMIAAAQTKNGGKLGGEGYVDRRKFRL